MFFPMQRSAIARTQTRMLFLAMALAAATLAPLVVLAGLFS